MVLLQRNQKKQIIMKIEINNLVELVIALEECGSLYYKDGTELMLSHGKRYVGVKKDDRIWRSIDLSNFTWGTEFDTKPPMKDKQPVWCSRRKLRIISSYRVVFLETIDSHLYWWTLTSCCAFQNH